MKLRNRAICGSVMLSVCLLHSANADIFDVNSTTAGFGVTNGSSYNWLDAAGYWADTTAVNDGTAATVAWQGSSGVSEQAYFIGSGTAGQNYTVRLGASGATDVFIQNLALNVNAAGGGALASTAGNVTIGNVGDTGNLIMRAANSVGAQNSGILTINNGLNLNGFTMNYRGGNVVINGNVSGSAASSNISTVAGVFGLTSGTLTLAGDNSFAGNVSVTSGYTLILRHANALGATGGANSVAAGGAMEVGNGVTIGTGESITISGDGGSSNPVGALRAGSGGGTWSGGVTLGASNTRLGATTGNTLTVTGTISSSGATSGLLISGQSGTGVVVLNPTTSNTYAGNTSIVRGILRLGKNDALNTATTLDVDFANAVSDAATFDMAGFNQTIAGLIDTATTSINGLITNSAATTTSTLTVNQATDTVYDGTIQNGAGSVALTKSGSGSLTLNGANNFTGGTSISAGTLRVGNATALGGNSGAVSVTSGAVLDLNGTTMTGTNALTLNGTGITSAGALINSSATDATYAGLVNLGSSSSIVAGAGNITLSNVGSITGSGFGLTVGGGFNTTISSIIGTVSGSLTKQDAGVLTLTGANTYTGGTTVSAGTLRVGNATALGGNSGAVSVTSGAVLDLNGTTMTGTNALTLNGTGISSAGALINSSATSATYAGLVNLGSASSIVAGAGNITLSNAGTITGSGFGLTVGGGFNTTINSIIGTGSGSLTKQDAGILTLTGASTYTGGTTLSAGTLVVGNATALGAASNTLTINGGTLRIALDVANPISTYATIVGGNATIQGSKATANSSGITQTLGTLSIGANTLSISSNNLSVNTVYGITFGATSLTGNAIFDVANNGTATGTLTISGLITETGSARSITKNGPGNLVLNLQSNVSPQASSFSGGATINAGTLTLANALGTGGQQTTPGGNSSGTFNLGGSSGNATATLAIGNNNIVFNNAINVRGGSSGTKTLSVSGSSVNAIQGGTITLNDSLTISTAAANSSMTLAGVVEDGANGARGITISGSGTVRLTNTNTYTGTTTINSGNTLQIGNAGATGSISSSSSIVNNGTISVNRTGSITLLNSISGNGGLTKISTGTLILSGNNSYVGNTLMGTAVGTSTGILRLTHSNALGTGKLIINNGNNDTGSVELTGGITVANNVDFFGRASSGTAAIFRNVSGDNELSGVLTGSFNGGNYNFHSDSGTLTISNKITTSSAGRSLNLRGAGSINITGIVEDGTGSISVRSLDAGTYTLGGSNNSYTGSTTFGNGTLSVANIANGGVNSSIGSSTSAAANMVFDGGAMRYTGATASSDRAFTINATRTATIEVSNASTNLSLSGATGAATNGALTKTGSGSLTLTGANTYTGATNVNAGKLVISSTGSTASGSAVTVANAGSEIVVDGTIGGTLIIGAGTTLSGSGTISGATTISGMHTPGNSPGVQTFTSDLTYTSGSTVTWELGGNSNQNSPVIYDQLVVNGNLNFSGATTMSLSFSFLNSAVDWNNGFWDSDQSWVVYDVTGSTANFENLTLNQQNWLDSNSIALNAARSNAFFTLTLSNNDILLNYTAVPETSVTLLGGLSALLMLRRRRAA